MCVGGEGVLTVGSCAVTSCCRWVRDEENWLKSDGGEEPVLCGNVTGAR
jgi:hypothetical protein